MNSLIKSPFNYIGGKYKLLPQLLTLFPTNINNFYDVFGGGGSVSLNVNAKHIHYNDIIPHISDVFKSIKNMSAEDCVSEIKSTIDYYNLSKTNEEGFKKLRSDYNNGDKSWVKFYTLMCYSFNSQFRFNNNQEYNSSFGRYKSCFSNVTEDKVVKCIERLNEIDIKFTNNDFMDLDFSKLDNQDFVYFDPPYLITCGNYNDGKRGFKGWTKEDDESLMSLCDMLNKKGIKFALSNVLEHKGKTNEILKEWSKKYNVVHLNNSYENCNYHAKDKSKNSTDEVLIINY